MEDKMVRMEIAKKIIEETERMDTLEGLEEMLSRNVIEWTMDNIKYRVRKPNAQEKKEIRNARVKEHNHLLMDDTYLYEEEIIKRAEAKGKSVVAMNNSILEINQRIKEVELQLAQLGKALEKDCPSITDLKIKIYNLLVEQTTVSLEKDELLSNSIEHELLIFVNSYVCYVGLEKEVDGKWIRAFNRYEGFINSENEQLKNDTEHYMNLIIFREGLKDAKE